MSTPNVCSLPFKKHPGGCHKGLLIVEVDVGITFRKGRGDEKIHRFAAEQAPPPKVFVKKRALEPVVVIILGFAINRVSVIIIRLTEKSVGGECNRVSEIKIGQLKIIGVIFHGTAIAVIVDVGKCRRQPVLFCQFETIQDFGVVTITIAFETAALRGGQTQKITALFTADINISIRILQLELAAEDTVSDQACARGLPAGFIAIFIDDVRVFPHFGRDAAEQDAALQNAKIADALFS